MLAYLSNEDIQETFKEHFPHRLRLGRGAMNLHEFARSGDAWCTENIGPSARVVLNQDTVLNTELLWARFGLTFYFKEQNHAFWFKMVWL